MTARATADIAALVNAYDFARFGTIADIGGGRGHLLRAVLDAAPNTRGVLFELPDVIAALDFEHERLTPQAGDFFVDPLPAADLHVLMEIFHDWPDAECLAILSAVRRAAAPGATVLVIETILHHEEPDPRGRMLDVIMLAISGGRERTARQFDELFPQHRLQQGGSDRDGRRASHGPDHGCLTTTAGDVTADSRQRPGGSLHAPAAAGFVLRAAARGRVGTSAGQAATCARIARGPGRSWLAQAIHRRPVGRDRSRNSWGMARGRSRCLRRLRKRAHRGLRRREGRPAGVSSPAVQRAHAAGRVRSRSTG
jgi:hypothetical protein